MKRPSSSSDPLSEDKVVLGGFQTMVEGGLGLSEEEEVEMMMENGGVASLSVGEKKRRLSVEQVKALEKNFEVVNKLEPERKQKLAQELGLQPRQVAVWFQNRRARWKTRQLERDYGILKTNYDALKLSFDVLTHDNQSLLAEVQQLKGKLSGEGESSLCSVKEEPEEDKNLAEREQEEEEENPLIYKDGSSDSDSSGILNSPYLLRNMVLSQNNNRVQEEQLKEPKEEQNQQLFMGFNHTSSSSSSPSSRLGFHCYFHQQQQQQQQQKMVMKMEENGFLTEEEPCSTSFFSDEQPPSLAWYCSDQWD